MEHARIEEHAIAERYICNTLSAEERADFEQHLVDCQECMDRILLAGMFHSRLVKQVRGEEEPPLKPGLVVRVKPVQLISLSVVSVLILLATFFLVVKIFGHPAH